MVALPAHNFQPLSGVNSNAYPRLAPSPWCEEAGTVG